ncbi:hypothetical protein AU468_07310 [Alkalispirochaeta sphaeroplastigenens]|uniref:Uncharacterized protein n=1 Tax=Alkalispirochaeta sphaeroplastigenens TaxID=1187066 RepID=A0A2S4JRD5_9SPIO|nr:hypothetical protein AU468_07310 [Alkalispirochaeta sphaeroplastigenens]
MAAEKDRREDEPARWIIEHQSQKIADKSRKNQKYPRCYHRRQTSVPEGSENPPAGLVADDSYPVVNRVSQNDRCTQRDRPLGSQGRVETDLPRDQHQEPPVGQEQRRQNQQAREERCHLAAVHQEQEPFCFHPPIVRDLLPPGKRSGGETSGVFRKKVE